MTAEHRQCCYYESIQQHKHDCTMMEDYQCLTGADLQYTGVLQDYLPTLVMFSTMLSIVNSTSPGFEVCSLTLMNNVSTSFYTLGQRGHSGGLGDGGPVVSRAKPLLRNLECFAPRSFSIFESKCNRIKFNWYKWTENAIQFLNVLVQYLAYGYKKRSY